MKYLRSLTPQQWVLAACGTLVTASVLISHGNRLGFLLLGLAAACGAGAFAGSSRG